MFTKEELSQYSRQVLYFGIENQKKLKNAKVAIAGAGGLGSAFLPYLASSGVGSITIYEHDRVELHNLGRQVLFNRQQIGVAKGAAAAEALSRINPDIEIEWVNRPFSAELFKNHPLPDVMLDGTDSVTNKFLMNDLAVTHEIPAVIAGIGTTQGHVFTVLPASYNDDPRVCYRCIFERPPQEGELPSCARDGVISPLPGVIGTMMAYLTVKILTGSTLQPLLHLIDDMQWRTLKIRQNKRCKMHKH